MINRPFVAAASLLAAAILVTAPVQAAALTHATVHLLAGPAATFGPVADVPGNSKVGVLWCGPANFDWCLIQFHKKQGWVHSGDITTLAPGASVADASKGGGSGGTTSGASAGGGSAGGSPESRTAASPETRQPGTGPNAGSVGSGGTHNVGAGL